MVGHQALTAESRNAYKILDGNSEEKGLRGRRIDGSDDIKMDVYGEMVFECVYFIVMARCMVQ